MNETQNRWLLLMEGILLVLVITPLLLFPNINTTLTLAAIGLLAVLWVLGWLLARRPFLPPSPLSPALLLWGLAVLVGIIVTADPHLTFPKATGLLLGYAYWRYIVIALRTRQLINFGVIFFLITGLGMMFIGTISTNWRVKVPILNKLLSLLPSQLIQLPGGSLEGTHANELGGTIIIFLPLLLVVLTSWQALRKRPPLLIGLAGVALSASLLLLLTQSRSAWIGAAGGILTLLFFWFIFLPSSRLRTAVRIFLALVVTATLLLVLATDWNAVIEFWEAPPRDTAVGTLITFNFRRELWQSAFEVIEDMPFTGTGLGALRQVIPRLYPISSSNYDDVAHAHNIFIQVAVDTGLPGLIAYTAILASCVVLCYRAARQGGQDRHLIVGLFAGLAGLHFFGLTDAIAPGAKPGLLFWLALGLIVAICQFNDNGRSHPQPSPPRPKWAIIVVVVAAVLLLLITQSNRLATSLYLRYIDYKWNAVELTGFSENEAMEAGFPDGWQPGTSDNDPLTWWQEHVIMPEIAAIPESALVGRQPYLNMLDMLNGRYSSIQQRIDAQGLPCSATPEMTSWLLSMAPEVEEQGGATAREKLYQLAVTVAPACPQPHGQLAQLYDENGAYTAAVEQYRLAAELAGETPLAGYYYFNEGSLHVRHTANFEHAIFTFERAEALEAWVTGDVFQGAPAYNLGLVYKNAGLYEEAKAAFQRVMACEGCSFLQTATAAELATLESE